MDNALAVMVRVQYTDAMLWKFKKPEPTSPSSSAIPSGAPIDPLKVGGADRTVLNGSVRVENTDVVTRHPAGSFVIPGTYRISGTVVTHRHVVVEGQLEGAALVAPSVAVESSGRLRVSTQVGTMSVAGVVEGPISVRDILEVRNGGALTGDVDAGILNIQPGGAISGARLAIGPLRSQN